MRNANRIAWRWYFIGGSWPAPRKSGRNAIASLRKGSARAPDDEWKLLLRQSLVWSMYKAGQAVAAHDEFAGDGGCVSPVGSIIGGG